MTLLGVNVEPAVRPWRDLAPSVESWWRPENLDLLAQETALIAELGATNVRCEFPWAFLETAQGHFAWERADSIVERCTSLGLELTPVVWATPAWVAPDMTDAPPAEAFAAFLQALVSRYQDQVRYWELWNEPDHTHYWHEGPDRYARQILLPGYQAIKAIDPAIQVVIGGPTWSNRRWMDQVFAAGGKDAFDIMAFHNYGSVAQVLKDAALVEEILAAYGQSHKPIWLGEFGLQDGEGEQQIALLEGVIHGQARIARYQWYQLSDCDLYADGRLIKPARWGLLKHDKRTRKPSFYAFQKLAGRERE